MVVVIWIGVCVCVVFEPFEYFSITGHGASAQTGRSRNQKYSKPEISGFQHYHWCPLHVPVIHTRQICCFPFAIDW